MVECVTTAVIVGAALELTYAGSLLILLVILLSAAIKAALQLWGENRVGRYSSKR